MNISIVIAARTGPGPVLTCLKSLERLPERRSIEVVVSDCCGGEADRRIRAEYSDVTVVQAPPGCSIAQARDAARRHCSGDIIAVLHERYAVREDWARAVLSAHATPCDVAGGCVAPSPDLSSAAWAMYLSEYSHVCPPMRPGPVPDDEAGMLPGGNVSYNRRALALANMGQALWELDFHQALLRAGARFVRGAGMDVEFAHPFTIREYIAERFEVSRDFAALRLRGASRLRVAVSAATRLALPAVLLARIVPLAARRYNAQLLRALPWMVAFTVVQTYGEILGSLSPKQLDRRGVSSAEVQGGLS